MNLTEILTAEQVVPRLTAADRWAVIDQLVDVLVRTHKIRAEDRDTVRKAVKDRETSKSTGIGYGIAIPHASVPCVQDLVAVLGRVNPGVDFQALDNQPVTICILLLTPQGQFQKHLLLLSTIARFLSNKENRQKLETAPSAEEILAIFRSAA
ncbi:MAG TPA: PTS sugar transporter subunit IIA [Verrucomicrobiae bacterium]|nr:PTS sugar transporter subunit IIA [Verrucomicrobiae bacterium]